MSHGQLLQSLQNLAPHIHGVDPAECPALIGLLEQLKAQAWAKMTCMQNVGLTQAEPGQGQYLTVAEVVERFKVTEAWLYRHKKKMPHSQPSRKILLFPEQPITKWFASRKAI
jgi:hypothetical protein